MLRLILRALAGCASTAALGLLASTASAELPTHPSLQTVRPDQSDMGPDPEAREEPAFGAAVVIRDELAFIGMPATSRRSSSSHGRMSSATMFTSAAR
jgi:hypothetical protein